MIEKVSAKDGVRVGVNMEAGKRRVGKGVGPRDPTTAEMPAYLY